MTPKILSLAVMMALGGTASAARMQERQPGNDDATGRAEQGLRANGRTAHVSSQDQFQARDVIVDADGTEHVRFDRTYQGLQVIGGDVVVHSRGGRFKDATLTQDSDINLSISPRLNSTDAIVSAGGEFGSDFVGSPSAELVVFAREKGASRLAYRVGMVGGETDGTPRDMTYIIDAKTGRVLDRWTNVFTASAAGTGRTLYSGNVALTTNSVSGGYELRDPSRGNNYTTNLKNKTAGAGTIFTDADNTWGNNAVSDTASAAADAQYGVSKTWDYYKNVLGRNGIANNGAGSYNKVHYGRKYVNAFWSDSCFCMSYGDGDGVTYGPLVNIDVAGHEMSHGVTSRSANLTYSGESGGLNEATSDIFGTMVEFYANNSSDTPDYLIGEKIYISNPNNTKALRFMFKPSLDGASPDCYTSTIGNLDVHYSSGVANHFFYLLAEGAVVPAGFNLTKSQLVCNGNTAITGVGRDAAAKIWYRALTVYLTSSSKYTNARASTLKAATDLYGAGSAQYNAVAAAWSAVSVN
ncbi:MAG TPA: M4 family metallopeptidase [Arenimonas sp.]|nr:M4 family metallopeptidase [Arenimonas sp.]HMB55663.1 M4 family metallopeptidase [Arenimonas sp.]